MSKINENDKSVAAPINDSGLRFTSVTDMLRYLEIDEESIQDVENGIANRRDEHAQVGALLARCEEYSVTPYWYKNSKGWVASLRVYGPHSNRVCVETGPTQLAAIRAAVEAAEQGVRE